MTETTLTEMDAVVFARLKSQQLVEMESKNPINSAMMEISSLEMVVVYTVSYKLDLSVE